MYISYKNTSLFTIILRLITFIGNIFRLERYARRKLGHLFDIVRNLIPSFSRNAVRFLICGIELDQLAQ